MKAVVFHGVGLIRIDDVAEPQIKEAEDAIIRITASSICGTDLHMVRGTMPGMKWGTILGHEALGIVEEVGSAVKGIKVGDRVVVCSTIGCGKCQYCLRQEYAYCDKANPLGPDAGTSFFGGPAMAGGFNGLQAEKARIPYADTVLVKLPEAINDDDGLLLSDIWPTGYMGAEMGEVKPGQAVAVFGCGPVGQMAIASAKLMGASQVFGIDTIPDRLDMVRKQGAIAIDYEREDPVEILKRMTNGIGPDVCIDAVGVDAQKPHQGPAKKKSEIHSAEFFWEKRMVAPWTVMFGNQWRQGDAPSQAILWCVEAVRKAGVVSVIGVYPQTAKFYPIGMAMNKGVTMRAANCSHRRYIPHLIDLIEQGKFKPSLVLTKIEPLIETISAYKAFDHREPGWVKVELRPQDISDAA